MSRWKAPSLAANQDSVTGFETIAPDDTAVLDRSMHALGSQS